MEKVTTVVSKADFVDRSNIDTDLIIPGRFLKTTSSEGLGDYLFFDWRYTESKPNPHFSLVRGHKILVTGPNFGCGSSREHAPWALHDWGYRIIIASSFADIFQSNAIRNGLVPITLSDEIIQRVHDNKNKPLEVDVVNKLLTVNGHRYSFSLDPFAHYCLTEGLDTLGYILQHESDISRFENERLVES